MKINVHGDLNHEWDATGRGVTCKNCNTIAWLAVEGEDLAIMVMRDGPCDPEAVK